MKIENRTLKDLKITLLAKTLTEEPDNEVIVIEAGKTVVTEFPYDFVIIEPKK